MASRNAVGVRFTKKRPIGSLSSVKLVQALGTPHDGYGAELHYYAKVYGKIASKFAYL